MSRPVAGDSPIVGLCGRAGTGKSTLAQALVAARGWARVSLAAPLRAMLRPLLSLVHADPDWLLGDQVGKTEELGLLGGITARRLLQTLGTEWGRQVIGPTVWADLTRLRLQELRLEYRAAVVDDVRFPEEAAMIRALGGYVVEVARSGAAPAAAAVSGHASERGLPASAIDLTVALPPLSDIDLAAEGLHRWAWAQGDDRRSSFP